MLTGAPRLYSPRKHVGEIIVLCDKFGFLRDSDGNQRFFRAGFVKGVPFDDLNLGDRVEFVPFVGPRGRRAEDVRPIGRSAA